MTGAGLLYSRFFMTPLGAVMSGLLDGLLREKEKTKKSVNTSDESSFSERGDLSDRCQSRVLTFSARALRAR